MMSAHWLTRCCGADVTCDHGRVWPSVVQTKYCTHHHLISLLSTQLDLTQHTHIRQWWKIFHSEAWRIIFCDTLTIQWRMFKSMWIEPSVSMSRRASVFARLNPGKRRVRFPDEVVFEDHIRESDGDAIMTMLRRASVDIDLDRINMSGMTALHQVCIIMIQVSHAPVCSHPSLIIEVNHQLIVIVKHIINTWINIQFLGRKKLETLRIKRQCNLFK